MIGFHSSTVRGVQLHVNDRLEVNRLFRDLDPQPTHWGSPARRGWGTDVLSLSFSALFEVLGAALRR